MEPWVLVSIAPSGREPVLLMRAILDKRSQERIGLRSVQLFLHPRLDSELMVAEVDEQKSFIEGISIKERNGSNGVELLVEPKPCDQSSGAVHNPMLVLALRCPLVSSDGVGKTGPKLLSFQFFWNHSSPVGGDSITWLRILRIAGGSMQDVSPPTLAQMVSPPTPAQSVEHFAAFFEEDMSVPHILCASKLAPKAEIEELKFFEYRRTFRFRPVHNSATPAFVASVGMVCVEWHDGSIRTPPGLWPLGIAPFDATDGDDASDIRVEQDYHTVIDAKVRGSWNLDVVARSVTGTPFPVPDTTPLAAWNRVVEGTYLRSLRQTKGGDPASILPRFVEPTIPEEQHWRVRYVASEVFGPPGTNSYYSCDFLGVEIVPDPEPGGERASGLQCGVRAELPQFVDDQGDAVVRILSLRAMTEPPPKEPSDADGQGAEAGADFWLEVEDLSDSTSKSESESRVRVGALDLMVANPVTKRKPTDVPGSAKDRRYVALWLRGVGTSEETEIPCSLPRITLDVKAHLLLRLEAFGPGGQDGTLFERGLGRRGQGCGLIIPAHPELARVNGPFILVASEQCRSDRSQSLALRLEREPGAAAQARAERNDLDLFVIQEQPFLVARVRADVALASEGEVGNWSGDAWEGPSWEIVERGGTFTLVLPPQAVGEETLKRLDEDFLPRPQPILYRFSPPASFELARSAVRQGFSEAPWNLRRLLGYPGQRMPGATARSLDFELLYGLTTSVRSDGLRLAELESSLGRLPPPLEVGGADNPLYNFAERYRKQLKLLSTRMALLRPWSLGASTGEPRLTRSLRFALRATARCADPLAPEKIHDSAPYADTKNPANEWRLRGGVDWGFESMRVLKQAKEQPSRTGELYGLGFSTLGGTGFQKAVFDLTTIFSDTFLGRTFFFSLERIGRIAVLWNRAKHVVIYERSMANGQVLFPDHWKDAAMLRKMREYVQVLEKERAYPEAGEAPKSAGFVLASRFSKEPTPVESAWGRDIPDGWLLPLHPACSPYPAPEVSRLVAVADAATKDAPGTNAGPLPSVWAHVVNPEVLLFFTSTAPGVSLDTNAWPAVAGVDFPLCEIPVISAGPSDSTTSEELQPDAPSLHPGYEAFSFDIDTGGRALNLLARRVDHTTEAVIENITLARRSLTPFVPASNSNLADVRTKLDREVTQAAAVIATASTDAKAVEDALNKVKKALTEAADRYAGLKSVPDVLAVRHKAALARHTQAWSSALDEQQKALKDRLAEHAKLAKHAAYVESLELYFAELRRKLEGLDTIYQELLAEAKRAHKALDSAKKRLDMTLRAELIVLFPATIDDAGIARANLLAMDHIVGEVRALHRRIGTVAPDLWAGVLRDVALALGALKSKNDIDQVLTLVDRAYTTAQVQVAKAKAQFQERVNQLNKAYEKLGEALKGKVDDIAKQAEKNLDAAIKEARDKAESEAKALLAAAPFANIDIQLQEDRKLVERLLGDTKSELVWAQETVAAISALRARGVLLLGQPVKAASAELQRAFQRVMVGLVSATSEALAPFDRMAAEAVARLSDETPAAAEGLAAPTMRLLRAFGKAPVAEGMRLTRERVAYCFHEAAGAGHAVLDAVDFTPSTVLVNRTGEALEQANLPLKSLGIRLPSFRIADTFVPHLPPEVPIDLKGLLPDFAGFRLEDLLGDITLSNDLKNGVRVTHGVDTSTRLAWVQCDIDLQMDRDVPLLQLQPVLLSLRRPHLRARTRVGASPSGGIERTAEASISADWSLSVGGQATVTLRETTVSFDASGRLRFGLSAQNIVVHEALRFVTDLLAAARPGGDSGLSLEVLRAESSPLPVGVRAQLGLALPAIQTGAFSISNLSISTFIEIAVRKDFEIAAGFSLANRDRPFTLTILFLGGGGWFTVGARFRPFAEKKLGASLSIGISAGASVPFDIGVASGGVYFLVSLGVEWGSDSAEGLAIVLRVVLNGELQILGLISLQLTMALEARYQDGSLVCTGTLRVYIKICWFIKIDIEKQFSLRLAGSPTAPDGLWSVHAFGEPERTRELDYVDSFGGW